MSYSVGYDRVPSYSFDHESSSDILPGGRVFRSNSRTVRSNVAYRFQSELFPMGRAISALVLLCQILAEIVVLCFSWNTQCVAPLRLWVVVLLGFQLVDFIVKVRISSLVMLDQYYQALREDQGLQPQHIDLAYERQDRIEQIIHSANAFRAVLNNIFFLWFMMGSFLLSESSSCRETSPHLYRLCTALVFIYFILLALPVVLFCILICCLPLIIRLILPHMGSILRTERRASEEQMDGLDTFEYDPESHPQEESADPNADRAENSCVICLGDYVTGALITKLPCSHEFHSECIKEWLKIDKSCPLCKQDIDASPNSHSPQNDDQV